MRFAAGHMLPKPFISAMFSMAYYTPGVLELLEGLMNPHKYDQTSMAWAVPVIAGKTYKDQATLLIESGACPIGVFRAPHVSNGARLPYVVACTPGNEMVLNDGDTVYALATKAWAAQRGIFSGEIDTPEPTTKPRQTRSPVNGSSPSSSRPVKDNGVDALLNSQPVQKSNPRALKHPPFESDRKSKSFDEEDRFNFPQSPPVNPANGSSLTEASRMELTKQGSHSSDEAKHTEDDHLHLTL
jgi:hypothetical protein